MSESPTKGGAVRQGRKEYGSESVDIRKGGDRRGLARRLLGRHVRRSAQHAAGDGHALFPLDPLGQAEVGDVRVALVIQEDIRRFQIAVKDAALVGVVDGIGDLRNDPRGLARVVHEFSEGFLHPPTVDQLHAEIALILEGANLVDRDNAGVVECGDGFGFVLKTADLILAGELGVADHLQGDLPVQSDLPGPVDHSHAAPPEETDQFVVADIANPLTWGSRGGGVMGRRRVGIVGRGRARIVGRGCAGIVGRGRFRIVGPGHVRVDHSCGLRAGSIDRSRIDPRAGLLMIDSATCWATSRGTWSLSWATTASAASRGSCSLEWIEETVSGKTSRLASAESKTCGERPVKPTCVTGGAAVAIGRVAATFMNRSESVSIAARLSSVKVRRTVPGARYSYMTEPGSWLSPRPSVCASS